MKFIDKLERKTVGIVGLGYIGGHLYDFINDFKKEHDIRLHTFDRKNIDEIKEHDFDYFFNCAGKTGNFRNDILGTIDSHILLTSRLLRTLKVKESFVSLSSTRIYGFSRKRSLIFDEDYEGSENHLSLSFIYNGSKKLMECMLMNHLDSQPRKINKIIICRLSNVVGRMEEKNLDDSTFFKKMLRFKSNDKALKTKLNKESSKDYVFIDDVVEGILRSATLSPVSDCYNIASGKSFSLQEVADLLDLKVEFVDQNSSGHPARHSTISIDKARSILDYSPRFKIDNLGIKDLIKK